MPAPSSGLIRSLGIALVGVLCATPALAAPQDQLSDLRNRIGALQRELEGAEESRSDAADALKESERAISDTNRRLQELGTQQKDVSAALLRLQAQSRDTEAGIASQQNLLGRVLQQQYLGGQQEYLRLLLNRQDPNQAARDLHYFSYIARARADLLKDLRASLKTLAELTARAREKSGELTAIQAEQVAQKARLETEKRQRRQTLSRISRQVDKQRREIGKLKRDENRLTRLIERLGRLLARKPPASGPPLANTRVPDAGADGDPFQALKGRLRLPVKGELANRFGSPRSDGGVTWKGLFIRSEEGQEVRAVASGRVVFADWLRGFGNLLILDHGQGFMSLYGNNETLYKQVGEIVRGGDTVAAVGTSGGNPESGLYFELRHQGKPLDPMGWVTLK